VENKVASRNSGRVALQVEILASTAFITESFAEHVLRAVKEVGNLEISATIALHASPGTHIIGKVLLFTSASNIHLPSLNNSTPSITRINILPTVRSIQSMVLDTVSLTVHRAPVVGILSRDGSLKGNSGGGL
jgi:hypothetical protein